MRSIGPEDKCVARVCDPLCHILVEQFGALAIRVRCAARRTLGFVDEQGKGRRDLFLFQQPGRRFTSGDLNQVLQSAPFLGICEHIIVFIEGAAVGPKDARVLQRLLKARRVVRWAVVLREEG